ARSRRLFVWDKQKAEISMLIFEGRHSFAQIAAMQDLPLRTLESWIAHPAFQERLEYLRDNLLGVLMEPGCLPYIRKEQRIIALSQMAESARQAFEAQPTIPHPSGVELFNAPAFHAFRAALDDIAKEMGERRRRHPIVMERVR
ncbi:MAG: hypothetical protein ACREJM_01955, partial [Candidatus Saccharimonadales bacterium]